MTQEEIIQKLFAGEIEVGIALKLFAEEILKILAIGESEVDFGKLLAHLQQLLVTEIKKKLATGEVEFDIALKLLAELPKMSNWAQARGIRLFHFTSRANLEGIRKYGLLSWAACCVAKVPVNEPGGNDWSRQLDAGKNLQHYVHLCFVDMHQMQYRATQEGRICNPIYLGIDLRVLDANDVWFSNMNATDSDAEFGQGLEWFQTRINWELIVDRKGDGYTFWGKPPMYGDLKHQWQAEALVPQIDPQYIIFPEPPKAAGSMDELRRQLAALLAQVGKKSGPGDDIPF